MSSPLESYKSLGDRGLLEKFHAAGGLEVAGVPFVGVDVHFQFDLRVVADFDVFERKSAWAIDMQLHYVAIFDLEVGHVRFAHVNVPGRPDDPFPHGQSAIRSYHHATCAPFDVAGDAEGEVDAEEDAVGVGEFD